MVWIVIAQTALMVLQPQAKPAVWRTVHVASVSMSLPPGAHVKALPGIDNRTSLLHVDTAFGGQPFRMMVNCLQTGSAALQGASPAELGEKLIRDTAATAAADGILRIASLVVGTRVVVVHSASTGVREPWTLVAIRANSLCSLHWGVKRGTDPHLFEVLRIASSITIRQP